MKLADALDKAIEEYQAAAVLQSKEIAGALQHTGPNSFAAVTSEFGLDEKDTEALHGMTKQFCDGLMEILVTRSDLEEQIPALISGAIFTGLVAGKHYWEGERSQ